ncbi:MAG TPA: histidine--tRNA ligase, partial [Geobacterales bacterium]|nr:histidine--tRNA ligase [Geobacterales bacterium]
GITSPTIDAQLLTMVCQFFRELGLTEPTLQINSLGCKECRPAYRQALRSFLQAKLELLCDDCKRRVDTNPLRALDCKSAHCIEATREAPSVLDQLCEGCSDQFAALRGHLESVGTPYSVNPRMVRGLDYYTRTTFELVTGLLGAQSAVAAGGRYDGLIAELGGPAIPGIGFAMGVERVALLLGERQLAKHPDLFIAAMGESAQPLAFRLTCELQRCGVSVEIDYEGKSLKSQLRRADKFKSRYTLIIGDDELATGMGQLKNMVASTQEAVALDVAAIHGKVKG